MLTYFLVGNPVQLRDTDIASLGSDDNFSTDGSRAMTTNSTRTLATITERIVIGNSTKAQALMVNAAVGEDIWKDLDRLEIRENIAEDSSTMVNHAISKDVLKLMMDRQDLRVERERQWTRNTVDG
jgi:hypothetical protein